MRYPLTEKIVAGINARFSLDPDAHKIEFDRYGRIKRNAVARDYARAAECSYRFDPEAMEKGLKLLDVDAIAERLQSLEVPSAESKKPYVKTRDLSFILRFCAWLYGVKEYPKEQTKVSRMFNGTLTPPMEIAINYITPRYENTSGLRKNKKGVNSFTNEELTEILTSAGYGKNTATGDTSALLSFLHLMGLLDRVAYLNNITYSLNPLGLELLRKGLKANNL